MCYACGEDPCTEFCKDVAKTIKDFVDDIDPDREIFDYPKE